MNELEHFQFLRPWWLLALPAFILFWIALRRRFAYRGWEAVCDRELLPYILIERPARRRYVAPSLTALACLLAVLALAGPAWQKLPQPVFSSQRALVIALDLSRSMIASDVKPDRLSRARYKVADMLRLRAEGQTALLAFAGDSFVVTPLTDDVATIVSQLDALHPDIMPAQGGRADLAIRMAIDLLRQGGVAAGDILVVGDEIDPDQALAAVSAARDQGYRVSVLGIGTEAGAPIPLEEGGFLKDDSGSIVIPALNEADMREIGAGGDGIYMRMTEDDKDVTLLQEYFVEDSLREELANTELKTDQWREEGPWLLLPLAALVSLIYRRGYLAILVLTLLPLSRPAQAFEWRDLWLREDQQAARRFDAGEHADAANLFRDPAWKGSAQYRSGEFAEAEKTLDALPDAESRYNRGNALARLGRYQEAIAEYEKALDAAPDHADAMHNKELVEKELQEQQQQQQTGGDQDKEQDQSEQQDSREGEQESADKNDKQQGEQAPQNSEQQPEGEPGEQEESNPKQAGEQEQQGKTQEHESESVGEETPGDRSEQIQASRDDLSPDEQKQAMEQWLRRIPDDPGGLLRRKFLYQYQRRDTGRDSGDKAW
jgi:Ca-activated chloride channel family protein